MGNRKTFKVTLPAEMKIKTFQPPKNLKGKTFLTKEVAEFLDVSQSSIQQWTKKGWVPSPIAGTGKVRRYDVLDCVKMFLIKSLAAEGISRETIENVMNSTERGSPLTIKEALGHGRAYLILKYYASKRVVATCVRYDIYGRWNGKLGGDGKIIGEKRLFEAFWEDTTIPSDKGHIRTFVVNLGYIARRTLTLIEKKL